MTLWKSNSHTALSSFELPVSNIFCSTVLKFHATNCQSTITLVFMNWLLPWDC